MERGYIGEIGNEFVFIIAKNIEDAKTKIIEKANGQEWKFDHCIQFKVIR